MLLIFSLIFSAVSLCLLMYVLLSPGIEHTTEPQTYFRRFRWVWPWVSVISMFLMPFLSWSYQRKLEKLIESAAYKDKIFIKDIVGLQGVGAIAGFILIVFLTKDFDVPIVILTGLVGVWIGAYLPLMFLHKKKRQRKDVIYKAFPFFLDMVTLCVEAGSNLQTALMMAVHSMSEGELRDELQHALNDMRTGVNRIDALRAMALRCDSLEIKQWVSSLAQAEFLGSSLGVVLRAQSDQFRQERFLKAEKQAAKTPVKLLFPLICFIFPCTFIVIGFPLVMRIYTVGIF